MATDTPPHRLPAPRVGLPATVIALGVVSLLTDLSSEMIYPLLPVFLTTVLGAGPQALGLIEGVAESTASLLKVVSGRWSDRARRRKPLVVAGYSLAGAVRPLIGLATTWPAVLLFRFADRIGKGLRTSPRDALITDATTPSRRGEAFGLQRSMDHAGAVAGPLVAAGLLTFAGISLRSVFLLSVVPAVAVVVVLVGWVREQPRGASAAPSKVMGAWCELGRPLHTVLAALLLFTLGNSTDAFLLLRLSGVGVSVAGVALLWSAFHVVKMLSAYAAGRVSDRLGRRPLVTVGWGLYAAVYLAFAVIHSREAVITTFLAYGLYYGLTEPVERAWVADLAPEQLRGTAFGLYHGVVGLAALPASLLFGLLWQRFGAPVAFLTGAGLALAATVVLALVPRAAPRP
ncbi:MAG TPA: MFS transporter [Thermoanaerobaculaceae bacterium]|nr:MFS transporter [Thermoanaerobaculaceae bacterium]